MVLFSPRECIHRVCEAASGLKTVKRREDPMKVRIIILFLYICGEADRSRHSRRSCSCCCCTGGGQIIIGQVSCSCFN